MLAMTTTSDPGTSGIKDIAEALGGGIKEGSLVLIEGEAKTGKSVLCQHIAFAVLNTRGSPVAYYSSEYHVDGLTAQMNSMSLDTSDDLADDRLRVYKIYSKTVLREPQKSLKLIINHIQGLPPQFKMVVIDSPSVYLTRVNLVVKVDFLQSCKEMCGNGLTIVMAIDSHAFEKKSFYRAYMMSDYYLKLRSHDAMLETGKVDSRIIKILEVTKLGGVERWGGEGMRFEIKPGVGIQILPFVRIRV
ncbi:MAG: ATPase domain-containing protein [Dehalococcoidales bacterium]|jgi:flagellar protein FlaH